MATAAVVVPLWLRRCERQFPVLMRRLSSSASANEREETKVGADLNVRGDGSARRFYKTVDVVSANGGGHHVTLDGRILHTPRRSPLVLPTRALALAIAAEWTWQDGAELRPFTMPLMSLAATATDQTPQDRENVITALVSYFETDTTCCRAPEGSKLGLEQAAALDPLVAWFSGKVGHPLAVTNGIMDARQSPGAVAAVTEELTKLDAWRLAGLASVAVTGKSCVLGFAALEGQLSLEEAVSAVRMEEDYQCREWGEVEGGHDIDKADTRVKVSAAFVFMQLLEAPWEREKAKR